MNLAKIVVVSSALVLGACATSSGVMDAGNGLYLISARASPMRGGATGAYNVAYKDAQDFCAKGGFHAVVVDNKDRDIYQSSVGGSWNQSGGSFGGGTFAAGSVTLKFRCSR